MTDSRPDAFFYWLVAVACILFGLVALPSIGGPFLLVGVTLLALGPVRHRSEIFRPVVAGVLFFILAYVLVAPGGCTNVITLKSVRREGAYRAAPAEPPTTECGSLIGLDYSGASTYEPPLWPAFLAASAAGVISATLVRHVTTRRRGESARDAGAAVT